jgi:hypothetical protein
LFQAYLNANSQYKACTPSNDDYEKASNSLQKRNQTNTFLKVDTAIEQSSSIAKNLSVNS